MSIGGVDIIDAFDQAGHEFIIKNILGRDPVEASIQTTDRPGAAGERLIDSQPPAREITVPYGLFSDDSEHRREAGRLLARIMGRGLQRIEFSDQGGSYYMATVRNVEGESAMPYLGHGELVLHCPNPYLLGQERTVSPSSGQLSVATNRFVEPVILWTTDQQVGAAWIEVDGERLTIDTGISEGRQIRIDCARKEVRVGGVLNVENVHGVFPQVADGSTVATSPGGELSFTYQERWL